MDYGQATFILTKYRKSELLKWESVAHPNHFYLFQKNKSVRSADGSTTDYYACRNCDKLGGDRGRTVVKANRITRNPEAGHTELCAPIDSVTLETLILTRNMIKRAENGTMPIRAYREGLAEIPQRCVDPAFANQVQLAVAAFQSIRSSLYRATAINLIPVRDPNNLPVEYQLTLNGREARARDPNDPNADERFMLANENGLLIFASDLDLRILHESEYWIADGTFEMRPTIFAQIYTVHAFIQNEAIVCCYGLLPNKSRRTYENFFTIIRNEIIRIYGDQGRIRKFILDFEMAVHVAVRNVFENVTTKGCLFHFGQSLIRNIQRLGLMPLYEVENSELKKWIRLIRSLAILPSDLVVETWQNWLQNPPNGLNQQDQLRVQEFIEYFETTWLNGIWRADVWNHFENRWPDGKLGPRTTNHAEGWHNRLNHDFGHPHPALNSFLHWLQQTANVNNIRMRQLLAGAEPRRRNHRYIRVDQQITIAKANFERQRNMLIGGDFIQILPEVQMFLRRVSYLLGQ